ncbi:TcfC E-set like domain-containing protein [Microbulbifer harenosus]|uniref:TcfC E-set like domain-containing protein n=1 Tax=Microbulbifer harenosus TaxID=2576840 RepID=UPI001FE9450E|nr:TcfC E-set like domain-containing protein [Microbulbifer harenosus]
MLRWAVAACSLCTGILAAADSLAAAATAFVLETGTPAGFSEFTDAQELVADLYFGGRFVGSVPVTVTLEDVTFRDPHATANLLPETLQPERVLTLLSHPLARHSSKVCYTRQQQDCGVLQPEELGIIYDESRFRVDVFFSPALLPQQAAIKDPYLPDARAGFSVLQNLSGAWSGVEGKSSAHTAALYGQTIVSFGESGLHGHWTLNNAGSTQLYRLHWTRDYRGRAYSVGLLQPYSGFGAFVSAPYLYGVEYRSSDNSRVDREYRLGSPVEVNMPIRGRLEILRDGGLIYSALLEAGNQLIDTTTFPDGAYEIEVRTYDEGGRIINEYREFFTKDTQLPALGEWQWSLQAGTPAEINPSSTLPDRHDEYFVQAGTARRLSNNFGIFTNLAATGEESALELGGRWILPWLEVSPSLLHAEGRNGHRLYGSLKTPYFTLGVSDTRLNDASSPANRDFSLLNSGYSNRSANISTPLLGGQLSLRYTERSRALSVNDSGFVLDSELGGANRLQTLEFRRGIFSNRFWQGNIFLSHSDADGIAFTRATVEFRCRGENWHHSARSRVEKSHSGATPFLGLSSSWNDRDRWSMVVDQQFSAELSEDQQYLRSVSRAAGLRGQASATFDWNNDARNDLRSLNYLGTFNTNLMSDGHAFAWGGESALDSAILVDIKGSEDQDFEVLVDGIRRGYARGDKISAINLPAFNTYDVTLRPLGEGFYDFEEHSEEITLYPGNVTRSDYEVESVVLVLGRILKQGHPAAGVSISIGDRRAVTDEFGIFQMQLRLPPNARTSPPLQWGDCQIAVGQQVHSEHWINLGDIELNRDYCFSEVAHASH